VKGSTTLHLNGTGDRTIGTPLANSNNNTTRDDENDNDNDNDY
jgi:hypothetical protein